jgi:hypothetical protein
MNPTGGSELVIDEIELKGAERVENTREIEINSKACFCTTSFKGINPLEKKTKNKARYKIL